MDLYSGGDADGGSSPPRVLTLAMCLFSPSPHFLGFRLSANITGILPEGMRKQCGGWDDKFPGQY